MKPWCEASGSEDEYRISEHTDAVQCVRCDRWFYLTRRLTLPRHLSNNSDDVASSE